ncbi:hypothetical protein A6A04_20795 [Paramagnetospirillum marisnigri]|jgi:hypothetical protein|uniref:PAS domain-containing protein n=1 Tax=Paramagnetospirillum marisnigri TaxID=1285242 RepID=A0A178MAX2_9PROT|nr:hypothetical protein A6A04_20795 [Paramagnetospirillum marisnigri]
MQQRLIAEGLSREAISMAICISGSGHNFRDNEIIVSKTDLQGRMTFCSDVFIRISGYAEAELV